MFLVLSHCTAAFAPKRFVAHVDFFGNEGIAHEAAPFGGKAPHESDEGIAHEEGAAARGPASFSGRGAPPQDAEPQAQGLQEKGGFQNLDLEIQHKSI